MPGKMDSGCGDLVAVLGSGRQNLTLGMGRSMLDSNLKMQLKGYLERISQPVKIIASVDDGDKSRELLDLLADIASASDWVKVEVEAEARGGDALPGDTRRGDVQMKPSFALLAPGGEPRVRFAGLPMGHEFTSLVLALLQTGGYPPKVDAAVIEQIRSLDGNYRFETFVSLTCQKIGRAHV